MLPLHSLVLLVLAFLSACSQAAHSAHGAKAHRLQLQGQITNYSQDSIFLYQAIGSYYEPLGAAAMQADGRFSLQASVPHAGGYFLGTLADQNQLQGTLLLIDTQGQIELTADARTWATTYKDDALNTAAQDFVRQTQLWQQQQQQLAQQYMQLAQQDPSRAQGAKAKLDSLAQVQVRYHQGYLERKDLLGTLAVLYYFAPYQAKAGEENNPEAQTAYFKSEFLRRVPFQAEELGYMPMFYQRVRSYVSSLMGSYGQPIDEVEKALQPYAESLKPGSRAHEVFMLAALDGAADPNVQDQRPDFTELYYRLGKQYLQAYPNTHFSANVQKNLTYIAGMVRVGGQAPEIEEVNPNGKTYRLSDLKGKVVLIDFWASWCGPCRRENPSVVAMYSRLKDQGFEIFSVSLDKEKDNWVKAIEQDKLTWPYHVSDLGFWQSKHARAYQVNSIPNTFLLDRQGRVAAIGLRGEQLEARIQELLAEKSK